MIASLRAMAGAVPWYAPILTAVFVWTFWVDSSVHPLAATRSMAVALTGVAILLGIAWTVTRDVRRAGLLVFVVLLILLSKGVGGFVANAYVRLGLGPTVGLGLLVGIALFLAVRIGWKLVGRTDTRTVHARLNVIAAMLVIVVAVSFVTSGRMALAGDDLRQPRTPAAAAGIAEHAAPDIFFIMLDGYPRADVLASRLEFDNGGFLSALDERGFEIAPASQSPYMWTHLSVPAMLNMAYVEQIPYFRDVLDGRRALHPAVRLAIDDSSVLDVLGEHGYRTVAMSSGYEQLSMRGADQWIDDPYLSEFELRLLEATFLSDVLNVLAPDFASGQHRDRIHHELAVLPELAAARAEQPQFVFAHVPAPHQPAVFGPDGEPIAVPITTDFYGDSSLEREISVDQFTGEFTGQLEYLNRLVLESIDAIVAESDTPPIIIVTSDHGSASETNWRATTLAAEDPAAVLERTGTLFAAFTPGHSSVFPDDVGPTDIFRHLFNTYLGTDYPRAERPEDGIEIPRVSADVLGQSE